MRKKELLMLLGDRIVGIDHIGSTSIKGLEAKPIIDIIVGVEDLDEVSSFITPLSEIDFEYVHKPEFI
ncbi:GrpB family protein [Lysinibacillus sphaericus]|uniref:GrpB family protein n=1 Tax=Lysinibacillus sphaericus TaxID=1421 RepID=UPI003D7F37F5